MNKSDLIAATSQSAGLSKRDTERVVNAVMDAITGALAQGQRVQLSGFGIFEVKRRQARVGRNPNTQEAMNIAATKVPTFRPSKALRETVAGK